MTDALSTANQGTLKGPTAPEFPGTATFFAHLGFVSIVDFDLSEVLSAHVHAVLLEEATVEIADLSLEHAHAVLLESATVEIADQVFTHAHLVSLDGEETEL